MFIGHYGIGYLVKKKENDIPLWTLFLAVQLLDIIAFLLVLLSVESASFSQNNNPFFRNELNLPYSHSLAGAIIISLFVLGFYRLNDKKRWGWILSLCVLSHWFIDVIVHQPDMSIFFGNYHLGLGLWKYPYLVYGIEVAMFFLGWILWKKKNFFSYLLLFLVIGSFSGMVFGHEPDFIQDNEILRTFIVLMVNILFIYIAYLSDKKDRKQKIIS